ncbi:MAG: hypothetical protein ACLFQY_04695 [Desulfococcaceae bacterium]
MKKGRFLGSFVIIGFFAAVFGVLLILGGFASAGQMREVVLSDGSVLLAEVVSYKEGVYTLRSDTMGELEVQDSAIRTIREPGAAAAPGTLSHQADRAPTQEDVESMKQSVLSNPGLLGMVFSLRNDPAIQEIIQDPEIMALVMSGDVESLESNQKFMKLMENPKIQAIVEKMAPQE